MNMKLISFILGTFLISMTSLSNAALFRYSVFNVVDVEKAYLLISSETEGAFAKILYVGSKTDLDPELETGIQTGMAPFSAGIHAISQRETIRVPIDLTNEAFADGYGSIIVSSTDYSGSPSFLPLSAFLVTRKPRSAHPIGPSINGQLFRIPVIAPPANTTQQYKVAITSLSVESTVGVTAPGKLPPTRFVIGPGHTALWDSNLREETDINQGGYIQISSYTGAHLAVSVAIYRNGRLWGHIYPTVLKAVNR